MKKSILPLVLLASGAFASHDPIVQVPVAVSSTPAALTPMPSYSPATKLGSFTGGTFGLALGMTAGNYRFDTDQADPSKVNGLRIQAGRYFSSHFGIGIATDYLINLASGMVFGPAFYFLWNMGTTKIHRNDPYGIAGLVDPNDPITKAQVVLNAANAANPVNAAAVTAATNALTEVKARAAANNGSVYGAPTNMLLQVRNPWTGMIGAKLGFSALSSASSSFMPFLYAGYTLSRFDLKPSLYNTPGNVTYDDAKWAHKNLGAFTAGLGIKLLMLKHIVGELLICYDFYKNMDKVNFGDNTIWGVNRTTTSGTTNETNTGLKPQSLRAIFTIGVKY